MAYLDASEYLAYGLSTETSDAWVAAASCMIDAYCRRSSLLSTTYTERLRVHRHRGTAQLTYGPVLGITAIQARCGPQHEHSMDGLMAMALAFGLPGTWVPLDLASAQVDLLSGGVQLRPTLLGFRYNEIEVSYAAGLTTVPSAIKFACAQIVKNAQATPGLNVKSSKLDTLQTEYFSDSLLDTQVKAWLRPFVAERLS